MASGGLLSAVFKALLPLAPIIFVAWYVYTAIETWRPLRHIPGPFLGKFSYLYLMKTQRTGKQHLLYNEAEKKYGMIYSESF